MMSDNTLNLKEAVLHASYRAENVNRVSNYTNGKNKDSNETQQRQRKERDIRLSY
jgi:hypothetical protein